MSMYVEQEVVNLACRVESLERLRLRQSDNEGIGEGSANVEAWCGELADRIVALEAVVDAQRELLQKLLGWVEEIVTGA